MFVERGGFSLVSVQLVKMGFFLTRVLNNFLSLLILQIDRKVPQDEKKLQVQNIQNASRIKTLFDKRNNLNKL